MVRRPVAWVVAVVLLAEGVIIAALNWFLGVVVDRQDMSLAGLDPSVMATSSKIGGVVFGLYFALCALVAVLVAIRDRAPAGFGRVLLISVAVVHGLLGAFAWGLVGWTAFLFMVAVLGLVVLLLMTHDRDGGPQRGPAGGGAGQDGDPKGEAEPAAAPGPAPVPGPRTDEPGGREDGHDEPRDSVPAQITGPATTTP
ncbi:hypothetical protein GCM10010260_14230 [Streptomyces filipinensis]|uniref:Uncharacterized protein n=1 Tax=Streptomyces filipinensis TaxID=66887 RepID=A0A918I7S6_9ACTN|nr:hypothetical protein [Streptomyces filipinensis]GGU82726.1 hypothetical protein GCM10010260_14230 [Streptomyces filipinensis]